MKNFGITSERALDFLNGDVKSVTTKTFDIKDGAKEMSDHSIREYNSDGHRILSLYYEKSGGLRLRQVSRFDNDGNVIGYTNYNANELRDSYGKYELDYKRRIVSKYNNGELEETYEYNVDDKISVVHYPNTGAREIYEYGTNGLATKQHSMRGENSLFGSLFGGPNKKLTTFENDQWGNIVVMKVYDAETKKLLFTQKNSINTHGDETESIGYLEDGSVYAHVKYEYEYDEKGNWVIQRTLTKEGKVYREETRSITYHSQNLLAKKKETENIPQYTWKYIRLDGQELGLLSMALMKNLFPKPLKGQLLVKEGLGDSSCILYFEPTYFAKLTSAIKAAYNSGAFARSNSEDDWNNFMYTIESAKPNNDFDRSSLIHYGLSAD